MMTESLHREESLSDPEQKQPTRLRMLVNILKLAVPYLLAYAANLVFGVGTAASIRILEPIYLGAMGLGGTIINMLAGAPLYAIESGLDTLIPQSFGKGELRMCGTYANRGIVALSLVSVPLYTAVVCSQFFVKYVGIEEDTSDLATRYAMCLNPNMMCSIVSTSLWSFMSGQRVVIPQTIIGCATYAVYIFWLALFVRWLGFGYLGVTLAMALNSVSVLVASVAYVYRSPRFAKSRTPWDASVFRGWGSFFTVCGYSGLLSCLIGWSYDILSILAGRLSKRELVAHVALLRVSGWLYVFPECIGTAITIIVGNQIGAGKPGEAIAYAKLCAGFNMGLSLVLEGFTLLFRRQISAIFTTDEDMQSYIASKLVFAVLLNIFDVNQGLLKQIIYGISRQRNASVVLMISHIVLRGPLAWVLAFTFGYGLDGIWAAYICSLAAAALGFFYVVIREDWRDISRKVQERIERDKQASRAD